MPARSNQPDNYKWRRKQLKHIDSLKLERMCAPAIGTADAILNLATYNPKAVSMTLRGTAGKYLNDTMGRVAGYKGAPMRKMRALLNKLCPPAIHASAHPYPYKPLPHDIGDEIIDLANEVLRVWPLLRTQEGKDLAHRILTKVTELYPIIPPELKRQVKALAGADPTYSFPPNLLAQFEEHYSLFEQLEGKNTPNERYQRAVNFLLKLPPQGNA
jgi:hypothetical protein